MEENFSTRTTFQMGRCSICGRPLIWDLRRTEDLLLLEKYINGAKIRHRNCKPGQKNEEDS
jgi:hypothetical protein